MSFFVIEASESELSSLQFHHDNMKLILIILLFSIGAYFKTFSQQPGYVIYENAIPHLIEHYQKEAELNQIKKDLEDSLNVKYSNFIKFLKESEPHNSKLSQPEIKLLEDTLHNMQQNLWALEFQFQKVIEERIKVINEELLNVIQKKLILYRDKNQIPILVNKKLILYCLDCHDYTDAFIEYLKSIKM